MDIVEQIIKVVLPKVLPGAAADSAESGLLSQFITIFATKIAGTDDLKLNAEESGASLIQAVFPQAEDRGELITKLAELHKVDESTTQTILAKAAPLVTGELNSLAGGNSLQSFLGDHLSFLGDKLPTWATNLIPSSILGLLGTLGAGAAFAAGKAGDVAGGAVDAAGNAVGAAGDAAGNVVGAAGDLAKGAAGAVVGTAGAAVDKVGDVAGGAVDAAGNAVGAAGDLAKGAAGAVVGTAGAVVGTAGAAAGKVGDVAGGAVDTAGNAVGAAGDLAKGAAGAAANVAGDAVDAGSSLLKTLLPILGLIGLGLVAMMLWKKCSPETTAPVAIDKPEVTSDAGDTAPSATLTPASFNITTGEGDAVYACNGNVGDQGLKDKLISAVKNVFSSEASCEDIVVDGVYDQNIAGLDNVEAALAAVKAVPNATANFVNGKLVVNAPDAAAKASLVEKLKGLLPDVDVSPAADIDIETEVQQSVDNSLAALNALDEASNSRDIARALNLQIINFAVNKADIPEINQKVLNKAVEVMATLPKTELGITGHTDSDGNDEANQALSERRANSVKAYLEGKGVAAERLTTFGAGETKPVADNATKQGKFRNRRISFSAEKVGIVEAVTDAATSVAGATAGVVGAVAGGAVDAVGAVAEGTVDAGAAVVGGVADAGSAVVDGAVDAGAAVVEGAANATANVAENVAEGAREIEAEVQQ